MWKVSNTDVNIASGTVQRPAEKQEGHNYSN